MGRITFGATNITRSISSYRARQKAKERDALIEAQSSTQTKAGPFYSWVSFDFNEKTRMTHITFQEKNLYKKIERYVTSNYVRHPVYSNSWSEKVKFIKRVIKLTNRELENLENNPDELIRMFRFEIIERINNDELLPSWAIKYYLNEERESHKDELKGQLKEDIRKNEKAIEAIDIDKNIIIEEILPLRKQIKRISKKIKNTDKKIKKANNRKKNVLLTILSFGIYSYLLSEKYKNKLTKKDKSFKDSWNSLVSHEKELSDKLDDLNNQINSLKKNTEERTLTFEKKCQETDEKYDKLIIETPPLPTDVSECDGFIPLKRLIGLEYQKIIGCYIIHNKEKDKYYVGQSKDVFKRILRDHFNGTEIKNIIFAEDYYNSQYENKEDLFEIKIIECSTKDELDEMEKSLIEQYDSFRNGYNGTGGNK